MIVFAAEIEIPGVTTEAAAQDILDAFREAIVLGWEDDETRPVIYRTHGRGSVRERPERAE